MEKLCLPLLSMLSSLVAAAVGYAVLGLVVENVTGVAVPAVVCALAVGGGGVYQSKVGGGGDQSCGGGRVVMRLWCQRAIGRCCSCNVACGSGRGVRFRRGGLLKARRFGGEAYLSVVHLPMKMGG